MDSLQIYYEKLANTIISNLKKRQIDGYYFKTSKEAVDFALSLLPQNAVVSFGGSMTFVQSGMYDALKSQPSIQLLDRNAVSTADEIEQLYHDSLSADTYFMSSNAITSDGILVNIDGRGNRTAALIYGPKEVIILAGMNKITPSVEEAINRVRNTATPPNCIRLNRQTPCAATGVCSDCLSPDCICSQIVITRKSMTKGRIKVLLIGETLGF